MGSRIATVIMYVWRALRKKTDSSRMWHLSPKTAPSPVMITSTDGLSLRIMFLRNHGCLCSTVGDVQTPRQLQDQVVLFTNRLAFRAHIQSISEQKSRI